MKKIMPYLVLANIGFLIYSLKKQNKMAEKFAALEAAIAQENNVIDSAITLLNGVAQQISDAKDDPAKIQALADEISAKSSALAQAVAANTPPVTVITINDAPAENVPAPDDVSA